MLVRLQLRRLAFAWLSATQLPPTRRPGAVWAKLRVTFAGSFSENEKVVPTGDLRGRLLALIWTSPLPSRHVRWDCPTSLTTGGAIEGNGAGDPVAPLGVVTLDALTVALRSRR